MSTKRLATLLHYANARPPALLRREFYELKDRLLKQYAEPDGFDIQHIPGKECWGCSGGGIYDFDGDGDAIYCERCMGDGWYTVPKWIALDRWRWHGYVFHKPGEVIYHRPEPDNTKIVGYVEHPKYGRKSDSAFAWLCVLTGEWRLLWRWLGLARPCGWQTNGWQIARQVVATCRWKLNDWQARCNRCGRHTWASNVMICDRCVPSEIPF